MDFWKSENGRIVGHGIHDHNSGIGYIRTYISIFKKKIENNETITIEDLDKLEIGIKRCKDSIDYIYIKFKDKFEENGK